MTTFRTADGVDLFYEVHGEGPRVYACQGGPANDLRYLAEDLVPLHGDFTLVLHDYRGCGKSASAPAATYSIDGLARDLDALRAQLGDEKIVVLGHSMGGFVAQAYAIRFPEHCARLILVGTFPSADPRKMLPATFRAMGARRATKMLTRGIWWLAAWSWRPKSEERRDRLYAIWSTWQEGLPEVRAREIARERRLGLPLENDNIHALQRVFPSLDYIDELSSITCPVLVLYGDRDAAAVWSARLYAEHLRDVEIKRLPGIGHDPFFEAPQAATDAVREFLR